MRRNAYDDVLNVDTITDLGLHDYGYDRLIRLTSAIWPSGLGLPVVRNGVGDLVTMKPDLSPVLGKRRCQSVNDGFHRRARTIEAFLFQHHHKLDWLLRRHLVLGPHRIGQERGIPRLVALLI